MGKAKGASGHDVTAEGSFVDDEIHHLIADHRRVEVDLEAHLIAIAGQQACVLVALRHLDRLQDFDIAQRRGLIAKAGPVQELHERQGRPVQDRQFRAIHLDHGIGDAQRAEGRHQVLDGRQAHACAILDHGVQPGLDHGLARDRNAVVAIGDIGAHEDNPGTRGCRTHGQTNALARVHADAGDDRRGAQGLFQMIGFDRDHETSTQRPGGIARRHL